MSDREIRVGDYVKTDYGPAKVVIVKDSFIAVDESHVIAASYFKDRVEPISRKEAFLTRLGALLKEFDASIYPNGCVVDGIGIKVGDEDIYYNMNYGFGDFITADNIIDFVKE